MERMKGTVYLLHFSIPYYRDHRGWVQHYIGWTQYGTKSRLQYHLRGTGSRLLAAVATTGRKVVVAREWKGEDRYFERQLKTRCNAPKLCPICDPKARRRAKRQQMKRAA